MTSDDARDRVTETRAELGRAMRALSLRRPDWLGAWKSLGRASVLAGMLAADCLRRVIEELAAREGGTEDGDR